jgi:ribosome-binding protein aMBF1 (putative translation factor)
MDQDFTPVILRKTVVKSLVQHHTVKEKDIADGIKKSVAIESIHELMARRSALQLTQKQTDAKCNFPANTIRDIEAKHYVPTEKQQNVLQRVLGLQLKVMTTK